MTPALADATIGRCRVRLPRAGFDVDVDFGIPAQGVLGLFGASGSGKTSILRCIAGLEPDARGEITIGAERWLAPGEPMRAPHRRGVGYVFQESRLFPHLSAEGNIDFGARRVRDGVAAAEAARTKRDTIELLDLGGLLDRRPDHLSGGERQRVAIARALLVRPRLLLMDEPLASLDADRKREILPYLDRLHHEVRIPIVYVSHDIEEMQTLCDRLIVLEAGRIVFQGSIVQALVANASGFVDREDAAALIRGRVEHYDAEAAVSTIRLDADHVILVPRRLAPDTDVRLRILARDVSLSLSPPEGSTILNALRGRIERVVTESTHHVTVTVDLGAQRLLARISRKSWRDLPIEPGREVFALMKAVSVHDLQHPGDD